MILNWTLHYSLKIIINEVILITSKLETGRTWTQPNILWITLNKWGLILKPRIVFWTKCNLTRDIKSQEIPSSNTEDITAHNYKNMQKNIKFKESIEENVQTGILTICNTFQSFVKENPYLFKQKQHNWFFYSTNTNYRFS